jgi:hypothetical protein
VCGHTAGRGQCSPCTVRGRQGCAPACLW